MFPGINDSRSRFTARSHRRFFVNWQEFLVARHEIDCKVYVVHGNPRDIAELIEHPSARSFCHHWVEDKRIPVGELRFETNQGIFAYPILAG